MTKARVIIDCDPGQDDAVALLLAMASPEEIEILGITTVAGNVPVALTQRNARLMCDLAGRSQIPVYSGCEKPLKRNPVSAEYMHGNSGIDGIDVFEPKTPLQSQFAVDFIIDLLSAATPESITFVATGPLTNLATAIIQRPEIVSAIDKIVIMGGAMREGGNYTPSAEFNIYVDPHAAEAVFECGRPLVVFGLDVTHQVLSNSERIERFKALKNPVADAVTGMLEFFRRYDSVKYGSDGAPLHDPCTVAYLIDPTLFEFELCNISVETESELTIGHTAVDFWHVTDRRKNASWAYAVDSGGLYDLLIDRCARF